jgi:hypothetical protein
MTPKTTTPVTLFTPIIPRIRIEQHPVEIITALSMPRELAYKAGLSRPMKLEKFRITSCKAVRKEI